MEGYGEAYSAITVINAFATGIGAAIGINLRVEVEVKYSNEYTIETYQNHNRLNIDRRLVNTILNYFRDELDLKKPLHIKIFSEIPPKKGLKSSSAVANALIKSLYDIQGWNEKPEKILHLNAKLSKKAGISLTGALDDASASLLGGLVVTDNTKNKIILHKKLNKMDVGIVYPDIERETKFFLKTDFTQIRENVARIVDILFTVGWETAAILNGLVYSRFFNLDLKPIYKALELNARTAGLSGKGPAYYMIEGDIEGFMNHFKERGGFHCIYTCTR